MQNEFFIGSRQWERAFKNFWARKRNMNYSKFASPVHCQQFSFWVIWVFVRPSFTFSTETPSKTSLLLSSWSPLGPVKTGLDQLKPVWTGYDQFFWSALLSRPSGRPWGIWSRRWDRRAAGRRAQRSATWSSRSRRSSCRCLKRNSLGSYKRWPGCEPRIFFALKAPMCLSAPLRPVLTP